MTDLASKPEVCPWCKLYPIRREQELKTWLQCRQCGVKGPAKSVNSNFAYMTTTEGWNAKNRALWALDQVGAMIKKEPILISLEDVQAATPQQQMGALWRALTLASKQTNKRAIEWLNQAINEKKGPSDLDCSKATTDGVEG